MNGKVGKGDQRWLPVFERAVRAWKLHAHCKMTEFVAHSPVNRFMVVTFFTAFSMFISSNVKSTFIFVAVSRRVSYPEFIS